MTVADGAPQLAELRGCTLPRLWTRPLRELTPDTSYGFDAIEFADRVLHINLDPWQRWLLIHLGEMLLDGRPRFRRVLIMIARQNGKSTVAKVLILYWLFIEKQTMILATSTNREYAREAWYDTLNMIKDCEWTAKRLDHKRTQFSTGSEVMTTTAGAHYRFAASNRRTARSLTLNRLVFDELREQMTWDTWNAAVPTMKAVPTAQLVALSNAGDVNAIVLNDMRKDALSGVNQRWGLFEWSSDEDAEPDDIDALLQANPGVGYRVDLEELIADARAAMESGGEKLAGYLTEQHCRAVPILNPALPGWDACGSDEPIDLAGHREKVVMCVDVALDGSHATLVAAALLEGVVHLEVVAAWAGFGCSRAVAAELPEHVRRVRPAAVGWFHNGPAAAVAAELAARKGPRRGDWPPRGVKVEELGGEAAGACLSLRDLVAAGELGHPKDPLLDAQVATTVWQKRGDTSVFGRSASGGPIDATYAAAGAAWLCRRLPPPRPPLSIA
jgi:hypothetical protein